MRNFIIETDSYKVSHAKQYPPNTTEVYSYFESRGGRFREVVFYGLQYFLKEYLSGVRITNETIEQVKPILKQHFGTLDNFNESGWRHIVDKHNGKLPLEIKAVPEGTPVPVSNVLMTVKNTDPECFWLTNYVETILSNIWYPCTVATLSREIKKIINHFHELTCDSINTAFSLNDFGKRGISCPEQGDLGGSAHLVNFMGTDNMSALTFIMNYYNTTNVMGHSIPASEHSTITSWGKDNEVKAFENMLDTYPSGLVACVSDSFDIYNACWELWGTELKDKIMKRDGTLVIRPDSGDPVAVVLKVINILGDRFGYTTNTKGYKVLDPHVRIIQGDGVNIDSIQEILTVLKENGWASENIAFGSGGALLQKMDRDTQKFAFKCSNITIDGKDQSVYKNPITDPGKISKKGRLKLVHDGKTYETVPEWSGREDVLETVFLNGDIVKEYTFEQIKENAKI